MLIGVYIVFDLKREVDILGLVNIKGKFYLINIFYFMFKKEFYVGFFYWRDEEN